MAGDEYSVGGGKLKLKGSKISGGRIEKKKKKSTKKKEGETQPKPETTPDTQRPENEREEGVRSEEDREKEWDASGKTEAERRAEEIRRKRVCSFFLSFLALSFCRARALSTSALLFRETDFSGQLHERLQREGVKTHKERVEELNKYLSRLSEHHDMYVLLFLYTFVRFLWALEDYKLTCYIGRRLDRAKWVLRCFKWVSARSHNFSSRIPTTSVFVLNAFCPTVLMPVKNLPCFRDDP